MRASPIVNSISTFHNLHFYFPRSALNAINEAEGVPPCPDIAHNPGEGFEDSILQGLGRSLIPAFERPDEANTLFVDHVTVAAAAYMASLLGGGVLARPVVGALRRPQLERIREMIRANPPGELRIADLAAECCMTVGAFRASFRKSTGVSPHEWLLQCRDCDGLAQGALGDS